MGFTVFTPTAIEFIPVEKTAARCQLWHRRQQRQRLILMYTASITRLLGEASRHTKWFIQQEAALLKAELTEKLAHYGRASTRTGIGAFVAYAALLVLLAGIGALLTFAFQKLGLGLLPASGVGFGATGLLVIIIGATMLLKGIKQLSRTSLAPDKTLSTIQRVKGNIVPQADAKKPEKPEKAKHSAKDLEGQVLATEDRLGKNLEALAGRLSPTRHLHTLSKHVQARPVRWNLAALATGFAGSVWFVKKLRR